MTFYMFSLNISSTLNISKAQPQLSVGKGFIIDSFLSSLSL